MDDFPGSSSVSSLACPSCGATDVVDVGRIPDSGGIGIAISRPTHGGNLYRCMACELFFKFPRLSKNDLDQCYRTTEEPRWEWEFGERYDWGLAADRIRAGHVGGDILDVGCNDGAFLHGLGPGYGRYGIELNVAASERAQKRGVIVVGAEVYCDVPRVALQFDVITAFDVIEHVDQPVEFLRILIARLRPGGEVIISTGNTSARSWRFLGSRYWYCWYPEHIVFINPVWAAGTADRLGVSMVEATAFSYGHAMKVNRFAELIHNTAYKCLPGLYAWLRRRWSNDATVRQSRELSFQPPGWSTAKDHMLFRFRKNDQ